MKRKRKAKFRVGDRVKMSLRRFEGKVTEINGAVINVQLSGCSAIIPFYADELRPLTARERDGR